MGSGYNEGKGITVVPPQEAHEDRVNKMTERKPKILIATPRDLKSRSNGSITRVNKIQSLLTDSCEAELFGFRFFSDKQKFLWPILMPFWTLILTKELFRVNWDFVYCYSQRYLIILLKILKFIAHKKFKIIYDSVLTWKLLPLSRLSRKFRKVIECFAGKVADHVVVVSKLSEEFFKEKKPVLIPTLVDTQIFKRDLKKKLKVRTNYGINNTEKVLGLIGPFDNDYNRPALLFLQRNIKNFDKRIKFLVIGKVSGKDKVGLENVIYTGFVQDYIDHLSALDGALVIRYIPTDGAINRIVEAMAVGLLVFANPTAGRTVELAIPGRDFFIFKEDELPNRVNEIIFNEELLMEVSKNARYVAERYYSAENYKQKLLNILLR